MNILYGVQTTGNGHIVRSTAMIKELRKRGHEVHALLSGCKRKKIVDPQVFQSFIQKDGLTFVVENGRIRYLKTALQLNFLQFFRDIHSFDARSYDLVVTDYEPISARIARKHKIPSIGIGHLYAFQHKVPLAKSNPFPKLIMNHYAPVQYPVGLHWDHFHQPILPPTIPEDVRLCRSMATEENHYLVYLPFEDHDTVLTTLAQLPHSFFRVYANVEKPLQQDHISVLPFSRQGFINDLATCRGAICNAGFSFISEALHLGKRVLCKAVKGQLEQQCNALALEDLQLGTAAGEITPPVIESWLSTPAPPPLNFPRIIPMLVDWIHSQAYDDYQELIRLAWQSSAIANHELRNPVFSEA